MAMLAHAKLVIASAATRPPVLKSAADPASAELPKECCSIAETSRRATSAGTVAQAIEARARSRHAPTVCGIPAGRNRTRTAPAARSRTARPSGRWSTASASRKLSWSWP